MTGVIIQGCLPIWSPDIKWPVWSFKAVYLFGPRIGGDRRDRSRLDGIFGRDLNNKHCIINIKVCQIGILTLLPRPPALHLFAAGPFSYLDAELLAKGEGLPAARWGEEGEGLMTSPWGEEGEVDSGEELCFP